MAFASPVKQMIFALKNMANLGLGWVYSNQDQHEESISYFDNVLKIDENNQLALISKVNSLIWLKEYDEAKTILKKCLKLFPNSPYVYDALGLIYLNNNQLNEAEKTFKKVLSINNKTYTCPYEGLGMVYYKQGNIKGAKENLEKSIEINPNIEFKKYNTLAKIYIDEGNYQRAQELLKKSIENYPYDNESIQLLKSIQKNLR